MKNDIKIWTFIEIIIAIFSIIIGIVTKEIAWIICFLAFINSIIKDFYFNKTIKIVNRVIQIKNDLIEEQEQIMKNQRVLINNLESKRVVELKDIKIPKYYKPPRESKMKSKVEYYNTHKEFKEEILIDRNNYLKDGYTSYLIAKDLGHNCVMVREV